MLGWNRLVTLNSGGETIANVPARIDTRRVRDSSGAVITEWTVEVDAWTRYPSGAVPSAGHGMTWERFPSISRDTTLGKPVPDLDSVGGTLCFPFTEEN